MVFSAIKVLTIEPMINAGNAEIKHLPDGWSVVTKHRSLSVQWEYMVAVTKNGFEVLTPWPDSYGDYTAIVSFPEERSTTS